MVNNLIDLAFAYHKLFLKAKLGREERLQQTHLQETAARHGPVAGPVALPRRPVAQAVAPLLDHVKPLGVPDVSLQPPVLLLSTVKFQHPVYVTSSRFVAFGFRVFFFLMYSFLRLWFHKQKQIPVCQHLGAKFNVKHANTQLLNKWNTCKTLLSLINFPA